MKSFLTTVGILLLFATPAIAGTVHFHPSWALETKSGRFIDIVSLTTKYDKSKEIILVYTTLDGKKGKLKASLLANEEDLIAALEGAKEKRDSVYKQPYRPVQNRRIASRSRSRQAQATGPTSTILNNCKIKWDTDYRMVDYCVKKQNEALNNIRRMQGPILQECLNKWGDDYRMAEYCTKKQTEAKRRVDRY